ncbi:hypothetical protein ANN_04036 [Periplaneta americana]|uniref:Uncharacterized protein n=1 Tax=Periplaneta americana TaxID=6978 RepID=A0ABQ8T7G4_PERAM|nr:hypothetical protein ANN_04036 [Periplaneta americana]
MEHFHSSGTACIQAHASCDIAATRNTGADILSRKRHAGWKSSTVAEGYKENSMQNKMQFAKMILYESNRRATSTRLFQLPPKLSESAVISTYREVQSSISLGKCITLGKSTIPITFNKCTNFIINSNVKEPAQLNDDDDDDDDDDEDEDVDGYWPQVSKSSGGAATFGLWAGTIEGYTGKNEQRHVSIKDQNNLPVLTSPDDEVEGFGVTDPEGLGDMVVEQAVFSVDYDGDVAEVVVSTDTLLISVSRWRSVSCDGAKALSDTRSSESTHFILSGSSFKSLMLAGSEFQSLGRAIVKEDEYEEVRWDGIVSIVS